MEKQRVNGKRVLARRLARELRPEELSAIGGRGTSYAGTFDAGGRCSDAVGMDCCVGGDRLVC